MAATRASDPQPTALPPIAPALEHAARGEAHRPAGGEEGGPEGAAAVARAGGRYGGGQEPIVEAAREVALRAREPLALLAHAFERGRARRLRALAERAHVFAEIAEVVGGHARRRRRPRGLGRLRLVGARAEM